MVIKWPFISHKFHFIFLQNSKKTGSKYMSVYVISFDLIQILISLASQNDGQIFSFVKASNVVGKKWPETVLKCPTPRVVRFISDQSLFWFWHVNFILIREDFFMIPISKIMMPLLYLDKFPQVLMTHVKNLPMSVRWT